MSSRIVPRSSIATSNPFSPRSVPTAVYSRSVMSLMVKIPGFRTGRRFLSLLRAPPLAAFFVHPPFARCRYHSASADPSSPAHV